MHYSFIERVPKSPFSPAIRRVCIGGGILIGLLLAASTALHVMNSDERSAIAKEQKAQETIALQTVQLQDREAHFAEKKALWQQTVATDQFLADQLGDLLDLIPEDAVLSHFSYENGTIVFEGETPRFETLKEDLERALTGRYSVESATSEAEKFSLRLRATGGLQ